MTKVPAAAEPSRVSCRRSRASSKALWAPAASARHVSGDAVPLHSGDEPDGDDPVHEAGDVNAQHDGCAGARDHRLRSNAGHPRERAARVPDALCGRAALAGAADAASPYHQRDRKARFARNPSVRQHIWGGDRRTAVRVAGPHRYGGFKLIPFGFRSVVRALHVGCAGAVFSVLAAATRGVRRHEGTKGTPRTRRRHPAPLPTRAEVVSGSAAGRLPRNARAGAESVSCQHRRDAGGNDNYGILCRSGYRVHLPFRSPFSRPASAGLVGGLAESPASRAAGKVSSR